MENKELFAAMIKMQAELPIVTKSSSNPFFKSKYADLEEVVSASRPVLAKYGLGVFQEPITENGETYLRTLIVHSSGQSRESQIKVTPVDGKLPSLGAAITYLKRYVYCSLLGIVADNDDDGGNPNSYKSQPKYNQPEPEIEYISADQVDSLRAALKEEKDLTGAILKHYDILSFKELKASEYQRVMNRIIEHKNKNLSIYNPNK